VWRTKRQRASEKQGLGRMRRGRRQQKREEKKGRRTVNDRVGQAERKGMGELGEREAEKR
jgi:hypothetical protein